MARAIREPGLPGCCHWIQGLGISEVSRQLNVGEYECFCMAASKWGVPLCRVREDFARYLRSDELPLYMEDWLSQMDIEQAETC